jgi:hypothetical protein
MTTVACDGVGPQSSADLEASRIRENARPIKPWRFWILPCDRYGLSRPRRSYSILTMSVDPSFQAELVFRSGFGALVGGMFGMGWLGWGLGTAHAFTATATILFDVLGILLLGYSIYFIRKGRSLRGNHPAPSNMLTQRMKKRLNPRAFLVLICRGAALCKRRSSLAFPFLSASSHSLYPSSESMPNQCSSEAKR